MLNVTHGADLRPRRTVTFRRHRRIRLVILLLLVTAGAIALSWAGTALIVSVPLEAPDAIVVLASHEWERLPDAAALAKRYPLAAVWLTVPQVPTIHNCHDCEKRVERLVAAGVEAARIVKLPLRVANTRDEARAAKAECAARGTQRLIVVTSPYHTRRAWRTFQQVFDGAPVRLGIVPSKSSPARPRRWFLAGYDRAYVRYEWAALIYRSIRP